MQRIARVLRPLSLALLRAAAVFVAGAGCAAIAGIDAPVDRTGRDASAGDAADPDGLADAGDGDADSFAEISDSPVEAPTCTAFSAPYDCYNSVDTLMVPEPSQYCFATGPDPAMATLTQVPTPPECQCLETFNCTCILAHSTNFPCASVAAICHEGGTPAEPVLNIECP